MECCVGKINRLFNVFGQDRKKMAVYLIWTTNARVLKWQVLPLGKGKERPGDVIGDNKI